jgi:hypothetical protein
MQRAPPKDSPQAGQRASNSKTSKPCPQRPQAHTSPSGGSDPHEGQA